MLKTITENWVDLSTIHYFQFAFCCERCGNKFVSDKIEFIHHFPSILSEEQKLARDIMWHANHYEALARANLQAAVHFNECHMCGNFVCEDCCTTDGSELCLDCAKKQ